MTTTRGPVSYFPAIEEKYGRPVAEWLAVLADSGLGKQGELVALLKNDHAVGHGHATALAAYHLHPEKWAR
ncbi:DUF4287 domain-containing protein [Nocardia thailandica]|uniref:DUF4287 domain-containing protein n=1 Tax=Nocardia thailandica TaxID=257275 RepID=A0ABW6PKV5_9NOCA|nr:DUF4287 domain-containing protein [Nocardia thailandica]